MKTKDIEKAIADDTPLAVKPKKFDSVIVYLRGVRDVGGGRYGATEQRCGAGRWTPHNARCYRPADLCSSADAEATIAAERAIADRWLARRQAKERAHTHHVTLATQLQAAGINAEGSEQGVVLRGTVEELTTLVDALIAGKGAR